MHAHNKQKLWRTSTLPSPTLQIWGGISLPSIRDRHRRHPYTYQTFMSKIIAWRVGKNNNQFSTGVTTGHNYTAPPPQTPQCGGPEG